MLGIECILKGNSLKYQFFPKKTTQTSFIHRYAEECMGSMTLYPSFGTLGFQLLVFNGWRNWFDCRTVMCLCECGMEAGAAEVSSWRSSRVNLRVHHSSPLERMVNLLQGKTIFQSLCHSLALIVSDMLCVG